MNRLYVCELDKAEIDNVSGAGLTVVLCFAVCASFSLIKADPVLTAQCYETCRNSVVLLIAKEIRSFVS